MAVRRFSWILATGLEVAALALCPAWAQMAPHVRAPTESTNSIHVQSPLVLVPLSVIDASGNFVADLHPEQFHIWDDGVEQQIASFSAATEPVAAVIVVETGKEVAPMLPEIQPLGILLSRLLLGDSGEAAVMTYGDRTKTIQNFSGDPELLDSNLRRLKTDGSKNVRLNDAVERAIFMLASQAGARQRVVIVFSEGFDRGSVTSGAEIVRAASTANVTIYGIRFSPAGTELKADGRSTLEQTFGPCPAAVGNRAHPCNFAINFAPMAVLGAKTGSRQLRRNLLAQYAGYSGGIVYTHWREHAVQDQLQNIALAVNGQYELAYRPTVLNNTGFHTLKITISDPEFRVLTRAGYFYAPPRE